MYFKTFEEIMEYAINKEKEAEQFYLEASERESFSGTRELFREFALEERGHVNMLENIAKKKEDMEGFREKSIPDLRISDTMVELTYEPDMSYDDILRLAITREQKALKLYTDLGLSAETESLKKVFRVLAQEESKHKLRLVTALDDYLAKMGG
ncbi:MAG: ferritin family protein [Deltaproteobacteria bacterium]|nr:ferritin family protein [Deltaproteobacteria bacterium]